MVALWESLVETLGNPTVHVLMKRVIWQTAQRHPDIALIQHDDGGLTFEALGKSYATRPQEEIDAALGDLYADLLLLTERLVGSEMALRLAGGSRPPSIRLVE
jgi:hypothetical protein